MTATSEQRYDTITASLLEDGGVLSLVLHQPRANVLSMAMMAELRDALAIHRDHSRLRLVIVRGAGKQFSFGASVAEHRRDSAQAMLAGFHALVREVASYPVPIAALVLGQCLGGAFELVLACHFVFATPSAVFACPEIKLGVVPPVLAVLGHHRLGGPLAERLMLTGAELTAPEADARGLLTALLPGDCDRLEAAALAFVLEWYRKTLAPLSAFSLREATHAVRHGSGLVASLGAPLDEVERRYLERLLPSRDANEGIEAFLARRPPVSSGTPPRRSILQHPSSTAPMRWSKIARCAVSRRGRTRIPAASPSATCRSMSRGRCSRRSTASRSRSSAAERSTSSGATRTSSRTSAISRAARSSSRSAVISPCSTECCSRRSAT